MLWVDEEEADEAGPGANVKLKLKNIEEEEAMPGFVLCSPDSLCHTGKVFDAQVSLIFRDSCEIVLQFNVHAIISKREVLTA